MAQRRFGPSLGAGTVVVERDPEKVLQQGPLGTVGLVGVFDRGKTSALINCPTQSAFLQKCGTYRSDSEAPHAALDFYRFGAGAGRVFAVRVTDGLEESALDDVHSRHQGTGEYPDRGIGAYTKSPLADVTAHSGGEWAGRERVIGFTAASVLATTIDTGIAMPVDVMKGGTVNLFGVVLKTYDVISNDAAGVLTLAPGTAADADLLAGEPGNLHGTVYVQSGVRTFNGPGSVSGARKNVTYSWVRAEDVSDPSLFGLKIYDEGTLIKHYPNLSWDPNNKYSIDNQVNQDPSNVWLTLTINHAGPFDAANRPADWAGEYESYANSVLTVRPWRVSGTFANPEPGHVEGIALHDRAVRQTLRLTFIDAVNFSVATVGADGAVLQNLPNGTVGADYQDALDTAGLGVANGFRHSATFTVIDGKEAFVAADTIDITLDPFPVDLATGDGLLLGHVYPNAATNDKTEIESNTVDTVTLKVAPAVAPTMPTTVQAEGQTWTSTADITFATVGGTVDLHTDTVAAASLAYGVEADCATLVATLNAAAGVAGLPNTLFVANGDLLEIDLTTYDSVRLGSQSFVKIVSASAELNLTAGVVATGDRGDTWLVEAPRELRGGYDGDAPGDAAYQTAYNTVTSPFNTVNKQAPGLLKLATPGVTATAVQKSGLAYAAVINGQYRVEIPSVQTDDSSAVDYVNDTVGRSDYGVVAYPSYMWVDNPIGDGSVLRTMTGAIFGREAGVARDYDGYHKAAAGTEVTFPNVVRSTLDAVGEPPRDIAEEITNPAGLQAIKRLAGGSWVLWGARTISSDPGWKWKHHREMFSHYERTLLVSFDWIIFMLNDRSTWDQAYAALISFFLPEWSKGAIQGDSVQDAAQIKIDEENNPPAEQALGNANASVSLRPVDTVERFIISVGKAGVESQAA